jgi:hypothetical protein
MQAQRDTKVIKPLTILGAEQKLFFTALIMDAAAGNDARMNFCRKGGSVESASGNSILHDVG